MKKYHKIRQFKDCIKGLILKNEFIGLDHEDRPIYESVDQPTITFTGTVKIHGTNAGIHCVKGDDNEYTLTPQSRTQVKGGAGGHMGFVEWVIRNTSTLKEVCKTLTSIDTELNDFVIFGEWAGRGIQNKVGVCELEKFFYVFDIYDNLNERYVPLLKDDGFPRADIANCLRNPDIRMFYNIDFPQHAVDIDLNHPERSLDVINAITADIEKKCPVAITIARDDEIELKSTIGEGIVWKYNDVLFKTKGEKHAGKGSGKKADIDPIMVAAIDEFIERVVTEDRIKGIFDRVQDEVGDVLMMKNLKELMPALFEDIMSEESDALINGKPIEKQMVGSAISNAGRPMFQALINKF